MQSFENKQHVDDLIIGYLKNELTPDQIKELTNWIQQQKENKRYYDECRDIWITSKSLSQSSPFKSETAYDKFLEVTEEETPTFLFSRKIWMATIRYAAIIVVTFLLGGLIFTRIGTNGSGTSDDRFSEIIVPRGSKAQFT
ncbi:MAG: hypothetical protein HC905_08535, partial [Bacteroidales bacterium]|nr:hypothetical protein [Bacteroidales bacterium]